MTLLYTNFEFCLYSSGCVVSLHSSLSNNEPVISESAMISLNLQFTYFRQCSWLDGRLSSWLQSSRLIMLSIQSNFCDMIVQYAVCHDQFSLLSHRTFREYMSMSGTSLLHYVYFNITCLQTVYKAAAVDLLVMFM